MSTIVIFDKYPLIAKGIMYTLREHYSAMSISEAGNEQELITILLENQINLAFIGIEEKNNYALINLLSQKKIPTIVLYDDPWDTFNVKRVFGEIVGLMSRYLDNDSFVQFTYQVLEKGKGMCPITQKFLVDNLHSVLGNSVSENISKKEGIESLSKREKQIFMMLKNGTTSKSIANNLNLKASTVSTLKKKIYLKLGIQNSSQFFTRFSPGSNMLK